jgi:hypothetical protein
VFSDRSWRSVTLSSVPTKAIDSWSASCKNRWLIIIYGRWTALTVGTPQFERIYNKASSVIWLLALWVGIISNYLKIRYMNYYSLPFAQTIDGLFIAILLVWAARHSDSHSWPILKLASHCAFGLHLLQRIYLADLVSTSGQPHVLWPYAMESRWHLDHG